MYLTYEEKKSNAVVSIAVATAIVYSVYQLMSSSDPFKQKKGLREIPIPDIGHLIAILYKPGESATRWHRKYGPILHVKLGVQNWVLIDDPHLAHKIFVSEGVNCSNRPESTSFVAEVNLIEEGIIAAQYGHHWKQSRAAALSILSPRRIDQFSELIETESSYLVDRLLDQSERFFPRSYLEFNTLDFISLALFGTRYESMDDPEYIEVAKIPFKTFEYSSISSDLAGFFPIAASIERITMEHPD
ncbi:cytochrome P450 [Pilobolus umbonatus]|nr:cytochrome P450 [Pilobolus umbonatus]